MPTYEYKREDGTTFELWQKISDKPLEKCPTTGQKVQRVITGGAGVVYKGDGWYVTDYKNKDPKNGKGNKKTNESTESTEKKKDNDSASAEK